MTHSLRRLSHGTPGIGCICFDEFHERSIESDLSFALCLHLKKQRQHMSCDVWGGARSGRVRTGDLMAMFAMFFCVMFYFLRCIFATIIQGCFDMFSPIANVALVKNPMVLCPSFGRLITFW